MGSSLWVFIADGVQHNCDGESRDYLESVCMKLPDCGDCYPGRYADLLQPCEKDEFHCGDGQCVHGHQLCDRQFDCANGADELKW